MVVLVLGAVQGSDFYFHDFGRYLYYLIFLYDGIWPDWLHISVIKFILEESIDIEDLKDFFPIIYNQSSICHEINAHFEFNPTPYLYGIPSTNIEERFNLWKTNLANSVFQRLNLSSIFVDGTI